MTKYLVGRRMNSDEEFHVFDVVQVDNFTLNSVSEVRELLGLPIYEDLIIYEISAKWEIDMFSSVPLNQCHDLAPF